MMRRLFSKIHLKRGHVDLGIDGRYGHGTIHANPVEAAGLLVASSGASKSLEILFGLGIYNI
jgi:hypothetical protein